MQNKSHAYEINRKIRIVHLLVMPSLRRQLLFNHLCRIKVPMLPPHISFVKYGYKVEIKLIDLYARHSKNGKI